MPDDVVRKLSQLNVLTRIHGNIPPHLLQVIQSKAGALAREIAQGGFDLNSSAVATISEDIIAHCTTQDFAALISQELGAMEAFNTTEGAPCGIDGLGGLVAMKKMHLGLRVSLVATSHETRKLRVPCERSQVSLTQ